jgi:hypothetical protein
MVVATDEPAKGDDVLGTVSTDKIGALKSQLQIYSLEATLKEVAIAAGDVNFANNIKSIMSSLSVEKIAGVSYVLTSKERIKFNPATYIGAPTDSLWNLYVSHFTTGLPEGAVPLSESELIDLWQVGGSQSGKYRGLIGPGEIVLTLFTDLKKGSTGDLQGSGFQMEVKGQNAKGESPIAWKNAKPLLAKALNEDGNFAAPKGQGFISDWIDVTSIWIREKADKQVARSKKLISIILGPEYEKNDDYVNTIILSAKEGKVDYGVFACQIKWYAAAKPFNYLLAFANPTKKKKSMVFDMSSSAADIYSILRKEFLYFERFEFRQ